MSKADEMFDKLGYKIRDNDCYLEYRKDSENIIYFHNNNQTFIKIGKYEGMCDDITMQELQAINEKCKELGWLQ